MEGATCQVPKQMFLRTKAGWDADECVQPPFEYLPESPPRVPADYCGDLSASRPWDLTCPRCGVASPPDRQAFLRALLPPWAQPNLEVRAH